jgi:hypothetical protein
LKEARTRRFKIEPSRDASCFISLFTAAVCKRNNNSVSFAWILSGAREKYQISAHFHEFTWK